STQVEVERPHAVQCVRNDEVEEHRQGYSVDSPDDLAKTFVLMKKFVRDHAAEKNHHEEERQELMRTLEVENHHSTEERAKTKLGGVREPFAPLFERAASLNDKQHRDQKCRGSKGAKIEPVERPSQCQNIEYKPAH